MRIDSIYGSLEFGDIMKEYNRLCEFIECNIIFPKLHFESLDIRSKSRVSLQETHKFGKGCFSDFIVNLIEYDLEFDVFIFDENNSECSTYSSLIGKTPSAVKVVHLLLNLALANLFKSVLIEEMDFWSDKSFTLRADKICNLFRKIAQKMKVKDFSDFSDILVKNRPYITE